MKNFNFIFNAKYLVLIIFLISFSTLSAQTVDTDGDGVLDQLDLDDDNDGIPDAAECSITPVNMASWFNGSNVFPPTIAAPYSTFVTGQNSTAGGGLTRSWITPANYQEFTNIAATTEAQAITNSEYVEYRITVGSRYLVLNQVDYYISPTAIDNTTYVYTLRMSVDNFATNSLVHGAQNYTPGAAGVNATINTSQTFYLYPNTTYAFRVYFYSVAGGNAGTIAHDDFKLRGAFECDTDGDNLPNRLDLDSDGDTCFDAIEGDENVLLNQLTAAGRINTATTGGIGTTVGANNGVPNLVNSGGSADVGTDIGQGIGNSQNSLVATQCLDTDGDLIQNDFDLDDDNDGILDTVECTAVYLVRPVTSSSVTANKPITSGTAPQLVDGEGAGGTGAGPFPYWYTNLANLPIAFSMNLQSTSTIDHIKLYGPWGFDEWINSFRVELYSAGNILLGTENFTAPNQYVGTPIFTFSQEYTNVTNVRFTILSSQGYSSAGRASLNEIVFLDLQPLTCDKDGDGTPNHLDLDSDGDACFDAIEGDENVTSAQLTAGRITGAVNAQGVPNLVNSGGAADIGSDIGQGVGQSQDTSRNDCLDSDGDGIPNWQDLDNDNDGILDTVEDNCTKTNMIVNGDFAGGNTSWISSYSPTPNATGDIYFQNGGLEIYVDNAGNLYSGNVILANTATMNLTSGYTYNFSSKLNIITGAVNANFAWVLINSSNVIVQTIQSYRTGSVGLGSIQINYTPTDYLVNFIANGTGDFRLALTWTTNSGLSGNAEDVKIDDVILQASCDTDGDGIPDFLDLDSDNDGCLDAIEGDENVLNSQLVDAADGLSAGFGSTALDQNLCSTNTCVNANGVPNLVNSGGTADIGNDVGQGIGSSIDAAINTCFCTQPPTGGTPDGFTMVGVSAHAAQISGWPENVGNGFIALDSQTKGFVITRVGHVGGTDGTPVPADDIADPVEGMMVYDIDDNCVKLFNGDIWKCIERGCNTPPPTN